MGKKNKKKQKIEGIFRANEKGFGFVEVERTRRRTFYSIKEH